MSLLESGAYKIKLVVVVVLVVVVAAAAPRMTRST